MRTILFSIISLFCLPSMADDFSLYYDSTTGTENNKMEAVANMQKITFENGNIVITRKDGTKSTTAISAVKRLFFSTDEVVGIDAPVKASQKSESIYDLTGRKLKETDVNSLPKGMYIIDGKKIQITK